MKKLMMAVAGVLVGAAVLYAQPPQGGRGPQGQERPEMKKPEGFGPDKEVASAVDSKWETSRASHNFYLRLMIMTPLAPRTP